MRLVDLLAWLQVLNLILLIGGYVWTWLSTRSKVNGAAIERLAAEIAKESRRIDVLVERINAQPGDEEMEKIYDRLNRVAEAQSQMAGSLAALTQSVQMIHRHLLRDDT